MILSCAWLLIATLAVAQTKKTVKVRLSDDGQAVMEVFLPVYPSGKAVVGCPGGGYSHLSMQNEGTYWASYFNEQGIVYGVLTYRMPKGDRSLPLSDAQNAIKTMRDSAMVWGVNPNDVGIMGFSAGGHLASSTATHSPLASRPNFQILFYPVISMDEKVTHKGSVMNFLGDNRSNSELVTLFSNDKQVRKHETPPAILLMASDDTAVPPATNGIPYYLALRKAGIPASLHIYPSGGHGFGYRTTFEWHDQMLNELTSWLKSVKAPKTTAKKVACIGNSITDGYGIDMADVKGYPAQLQNMLGSDYYVRNYGVSGHTMLNSSDRPYMKRNEWQEAKDFCPDIAIIKLGTNDSKTFNWEGHEEEFVKDYQQMIDELKALPSNPVIYLCTPIVSKVTKISEAWQIRDSVVVGAVIPAIKKIAKKNKLQLIDLYPVVTFENGEMQPDGVHPTHKGAKKIAEVIKARILNEELLK